MGDFFEVASYIPQQFTGAFGLPVPEFEIESEDGDEADETGNDKQAVRVMQMLAQE